MLNLGRRRGLLALLGSGVGLGAVTGLGGCSLMIPPVHTPMDTLRFDGPSNARQPTLLVMLPGAYSRAKEFVDEGFVDAVRQRKLAVDIVVADAHLGYYYDRSVLLRLRDDIVLPARARGIRRIWLVGISLGGFGAFAYAARQTSEIDGIVALAPYLGKQPLLQEIAAAGGPAAWGKLPRPEVKPKADEQDALERDVWQWLSAPSTKTPVYLGHGRGDRFIEAHRLLAGMLPAGHSDDVPGGHDWPAWRALWANWLDRGLLPTASGA